MSTEAKRLEFGDRVRVATGATGRYIQDGWVLVVSAQDNDLFLDRHDPDGAPPHPSLPVPNDDALRGAGATIRGLKYHRPSAQRSAEGAPITEKEQVDG